MLKDFFRRRYYYERKNKFWDCSYKIAPLRSSDLFSVEGGLSQNIVYFFQIPVSFSILILASVNRYHTFFGRNSLPSIRYPLHRLTGSQTFCASEHLFYHIAQDIQFSSAVDSTKATAG